MRHSATKGFWQKYQALSHEIQALADKQFSLLKANPQHPSLQFKKVGEHSGQQLWSVRVTLNYRALAIKRRDAYWRFWIADHNAYDLWLSQ